jgi:hypothetical protein
LVPRITVIAVTIRKLSSKLTPFSVHVVQRILVIVLRGWFIHRLFWLWQRIIESILLVVTTLSTGLISFVEAIATLVIEAVDE